MELTAFPIDDPKIIAVKRSSGKYIAIRGEKYLELDICIQKQTQLQKIEVFLSSILVLCLCFLYNIIMIHHFRFFFK
tara:strand:+ start:759 stop:989 length:231 start_codon:yes stop_codon:yes gene_type:complete